MISNLLKSALLLSSFVFFGLSINSCKKTAGSDDPAPTTSSDLTGVYTGNTELFSSIDTISFEESYEIKKVSGNSYSMWYVDGGASEHVADLTASGSSFSGKPVDGTSFKSLTGNLNVNTLKFTLEADGGEVLKFTGTRPSGGGNGGNGSGNSVTINGVKYNLKFMNCEASSQAGFDTWDMDCSYLQENGTEYAHITLVFGSKPSGGTYSIITVDKVNDVGVDAGEVWAFIAAPDVDYAEATSGSISVTVSGGIPSANVTGVAFNRSLDTGLPVSPPSVSGNVVCQ